MNWSTFKYALCAGLMLLLFSPGSFAQQDSIVKPNKYDKRIHRYRGHWEKLIPTPTKVQFAGNMGLLSFGTGWDYGKKNQWETDVFLGFIPKYDSKRTKVTMTLKQNYMPQPGQRFLY